MAAILLTVLCGGYVVFLFRCQYREGYRAGYRAGDVAGRKAVGGPPPRGESAYDHLYQ